MIIATVFVSIVWAVTVHAQVVPAQNQVIIAPYGGPGYIVSTSTSGTRKLEATTTPTFATAYINRIINLITNGVVYVSGGNGTLNSVGTSTPTVSAPITYSGTLGQFVNGVSGAFGCTNASSGVTGCLTGTDWDTFNSKQPAGNYITALTGDVSASGPGSVAATLATVNSDVGSFTNANITVNAKGLITAASNGSASGGSDPFTHPAAGQSATTSLMLFNGQASSTQLSAYQAYFGATATSTFFQDGSFGQSSSTPFGFFSINPIAGVPSATAPAFVVGSSSATSFLIANDGRVGIGTSTIGTGLMGQLNVESGSKNTSIFHTGSVNGFLESNIQNRSNGANASSDWVATADNGSPTTHYVDFGINGSGGGQTPFPTANHGYLYSVDDPLNIGALGATAPFITFNVGGGATPIEYARLTGTGTGFGTTTPKWTMTLASSTRPQLTLTDGSLTSAPFNLRANAQYFTLSTSSPTTFATSTPYIFMTNGTTGSTSIQKLSVVGTATSTITQGLTIESLAATRAVFSATDKGLVTSAASASLRDSLTDETGSGVVVFGTSPTFTTSIAAVPLISGGAAINSTLAIQGTSAGSPTTATLTLRAASTISPSMTFTTRGIGAGTTTPAYLLNLASSTAPQLALSDGSITAAPWTFRSGNGNFYLATGSPVTLATTSNATSNNPFTIIAGGISGLFGFASSTPWANVGITNTAGIPALAIGSTTATSFLIDSLGRTSIGSSSPWSRFTLDNGNLGIASSSITVGQRTVATSTSQSVDCRDSNTIYVSLGTGATTITLAPMVGGQSCVVAVSNPNATGGAITWATTASQQLNWTGGTVPTQTTTANKMDLWSFKAISLPTGATTTPKTVINGAMTPNF